MTKIFPLPQSFLFPECLELPALAIILLIISMGCIVCVCIVLSLLLGYTYTTKGPMSPFRIIMEFCLLDFSWCLFSLWQIAVFDLICLSLMRRCRRVRKRHACAPLGEKYLPRLDGRFFLQGFLQGTFPDLKLVFVDVHGCFVRITLDYR